MNYDMYKSMGLSEEVLTYCEKILDSLEERFKGIDETSEFNQAKVLKAMQDNRVDATCFAGTTGYGHDDKGRDTLDEIFEEELSDLLANENEDDECVCECDGTCCEQCNCRDCLE